jgi:predicted transcriptional regulator
MNRELKAEVIRKYGSQVNFSEATGIPASELSRIINGRKSPSDAEKQVLDRVWGTKKTRRLISEVATR